LLPVNILFLQRLVVEVISFKFSLNSNPLKYYGENIPVYRHVEKSSYSLLIDILCFIYLIALVLL